MASIHKEIQVRRARDVVWDAIRDVGAIHKRLVPGFVVDCRLYIKGIALEYGHEFSNHGLWNPQSVNQLGLDLAVERLASDDLMVFQTQLKDGFA